MRTALEPLYFHRRFRIWCARCWRGKLGLEENRLRVIAPEVGGGFGSKLNIYAEEALMCFMAMQIGKPVKWIESRRENFLCTIHGPRTCGLFRAGG